MSTGVAASCEIVIVGSGFAGSLLARTLAKLGYDVVLLERGRHPRFAIGESTTPLGNLSLERLGIRYGHEDCYQLATHGRWLAHHPEIRCGLKRGFTFYRHHPHEPFADREHKSERLLVAASPDDVLADTHWMRADVDDHFVKRAIDAGVTYRDHVELTDAEIAEDSITLVGSRAGASFTLRAGFLVDATGPGGFLARQLSLQSAVTNTETRSAVVFSHFSGVRTMHELVPGLPAGPYPDEWAAVHHLIDEGWMYALRFDDGVTSAGFSLTPRGLASLNISEPIDASVLWHTLLARYPSIGEAFADAVPLRPIAFQAALQHRRTQAAGARWVMLPHAYAFVDPLFSSGIAWSLRNVERLALEFEAVTNGTRIPDAQALERYDAALDREATQIDLVVAGAYDAMAHFELFAAHAMLYFAIVSYAEVRQRIAPHPNDAWSGFLGVDDDVMQALPREALQRLRAITNGRGDTGTAAERREFAAWVTQVIAPRNIAGLADPARDNMYPVDLDVLVERHALLGMTRSALIDALPGLRGMGVEPSFA